MDKIGKVVALCISSKGNVPKFAQQEVEVGQFGFVGDVHAGETRTSRSTKQPKPNDRQISLVALEVLDDLNQELGTKLKPGDFGENITTEGLGDLSDIPDGALIRIGDAVLLMVTEQNKPCDNLTVYHQLMVKKSYGRRGILAIVKQGAGAKLQPGAAIEVL